MTEARQFIPVRIAILTISDTRTLDDDASGQTLADRVAAAGHLLSARKIVKDDIRAIRHVIRDWTGPHRHRRHHHHGRHGPHRQ